MNQRTVVLNAGKMNYDGSMDFSSLSPDLAVYEDTPREEMLSRIEGAAVLITKELPLPGELICSFPDSVRLIVEAGTGYNNISLEAAKEKGITV